MTSVSKSGPKRKRTRNHPTYQHRSNAICVSVYHPMGETIPAEIRKQIEESVFQVAFDNGLLINIALT